MSYPASTQLLSDALQRADSAAINVKAEAVSVRDASAAGPIPRVRVLNLMASLTRALALWNAARATPNIGAYAQTQKGNATLDVSAEFTAMLAAATALRDWIFSNMPTDAGTGAWLLFSYDNAGRQTDLTFTTAQLAQLRTNIDAFVGTIS